MISMPHRTEKKAQPNQRNNESMAGGDVLCRLFVFSSRPVAAVPRFEIEPD
jgi:hypothetical protein